MENSFQDSSGLVGPEKAHLLPMPQIEVILSLVRRKVAESYKNGMAATERVRAAKKATPAN